MQCNPRTSGKRKGRTFMPLTQLTKVLKFHHQMLDIPQLYFHSLYVNSVSENVTEALLQVQRESGQVTAPLLCKKSTLEQRGMPYPWTYKRLCPQSSCSPEGAPLGLTPSNTMITAFRGHTIPKFGIFGHPYHAMYIMYIMYISALFKS